MFLSERREQSQHLADQLGVPLPPLVLGAANTPAGKRLCQEEGGAATHSPASTLDSTSSANTMTAEVREREPGRGCSLYAGLKFIGVSGYCLISLHLIFHCVSACVVIICQSFINIAIYMSVDEVYFTCLSSLCHHFLACLCHEI